MRFRKRLGALPPTSAPCVQGHAQVMGDVKGGVVPNDEFGANYLVSYAVNLRCPAAQVWQLRNSAAHSQPPADDDVQAASIPTQRG